MQHSDFIIGGTFWCAGRQWRCTDAGTRTIVAIRIDRVEVSGTAPGPRRVLSGAEAEAEGWFNGPPYGVLESVFDEDAIEGCSPTNDAVLQSGLRFTVRSFALRRLTQGVAQQ